MTNINLYQKNNETEENGGVPRVINEGFFISIGLLFIVFGLLVGIRVYLSKLDKDEAEINRKISEVEEELKSEDIDRLSDFYFRRNASEDFLRNRRSTTSILEAVEKSMVSGAVLDSINIDKDAESVAMSFQSNGFNSVAKQVLSLKEEGYFDSVKLGEASRKDNVVNFSIDVLMK